MTPADHARLLHSNPAHRKLGMIRHLPLVLMCFLSCAAMAGDAIRSFPISTIMGLGIRLYQQDKIASDGFDFLFSAHPEAQKLPLRGWITQNEKPIRRVFFIQEAPGDKHPTLAYTITFQPNNSAKLQEGHGEALPDFVAKRYSARQAAIAAIPSFAPDRSYNFEVLDDPENKGGFIVYAICTSQDTDEIVAGGHYRVTVAADAKTVKQVDALSKGVLAMKKPEGNPKQPQPPGLFVSETVSEIPVETHVYLSILYQMPLFVTTSQHDVWKVAEGVIIKMDPRAVPKAAPQAVPKFDLRAEPNN